MRTEKETISMLFLGAIFLIGLVVDNVTNHNFFVTLSFYSAFTLGILYNKWRNK